MMVGTGTAEESRLSLIQHPNPEFDFLSGFFPSGYYLMNG